MFIAKLVLFSVVTVILAQFTCNAIMDGIDATLGQYPYTVLLRGSNNPNGTYTQFGNCTASIIGVKYIITAGHCVADCEVFEFYAGIVDANDVETAGVKMEFFRTTTNVIMHPQYDVSGTTIKK